MVKKTPVAANSGSPPNLRVIRGVMDGEGIAACNTIIAFEIKDMFFTNPTIKNNIAGTTISLQTTSALSVFSFIALLPRLFDKIVPTVNMARGIAAFPSSLEASIIKAGTFMEKSPTKSPKPSEIS